MMSSKHSHVTTDKSIRKVLIDQLNRKYNTPDSAVVSELPIPHGLARIDIAVVNGIMHGYEVKSDFDSLTRLKSQIYAYNKIFDKVTIVVGKKHIIDALHLIPSWWGVTLAKSYLNNKENTLHILRTAKDNPKPDLLMIAHLLWKTEALELLNKIDGNNNFQYKSKNVICEEIVKRCNENSLRKYVRVTLLRRKANLALEFDEELGTYDV